MKKALSEALGNRSDAIAFRRRMLEAERDMEKAKKENGLNANLNLALGLSNREIRLWMFTKNHRIDSL
jgi:hypothetical protein